MLTTNQTEKVEVALMLIGEVKRDVIEIDYEKAVLLNQAAQACDEVLQQDLPEGYVKPIYTKVEVKYEPTTGERILGGLSWIAGLSLISSALCACISLGAFGISELKIASGQKDHNNYAAECRGYRGLCFSLLSITLTCGVLGAVVGDAVNGGDE